MKSKTEICNRCGGIIGWKLADNQMHRLGPKEEVWMARSGQLTRLCFNAFLPCFFFFEEEALFPCFS